MSFGTVNSEYLGSNFTEKERDRWRNFLSSSENLILSILLKYQEIDVQVQTFTDEIEASYKVALLNGIAANL